MGIGNSLDQNLLDLNWNQVCQKYCLDEIYGVCLPAAPSLEKNTKYKPWRDICERLPELNKKKSIRSAIAGLEDISTDDIKDTKDQIAAVSMLLLMTNSYLFCDMENIPTEIPSHLAKPLHELTRQLKVKNSLGYVQLLYNWRIVNPKEPISLDNIDLRYSFTGLDDEKYFFMVSTCTDLLLAPMIRELIEAIQNASRNNNNLLLNNLTKVVELWKSVHAIMPEIHNRVDPQAFYNIVRPYIGGYHDTSMFPCGVKFGGVSPPSCCSRAEGGSTGNDPLYHIFEKALQITYKSPTGVAEAYKTGFIEPHQKLVADIESTSTIRDYIKETKDAELIRVYNELIDGYILFHTIHWTYIQRFILDNVPHIPKQMIKGQGNTPVTFLENKSKLLEESKIVLDSS